MKSKKPTIGDLIVAFLSRIEHLHTENGSETSAFRSWKRTLALLNEYSKARCDRFDLVLITQIQADLKNQGKSTATINLHLRQLKSVFRWGAVEGFVPAWLSQNIQNVRGIKGAKDSARNRELLPIPLKDVFTLIDHLETVGKDAKQQSGISPQVLADLAQFQFFTACRSGEALLARPCDFKPSGDILIYTPAVTGKLGPKRVIYVGGIAKQIVDQYTKKRRKADYLFTHPDQLDTPVSSATYLKWIQRGCAQAGIEPFAPNRLRQAAGEFLYRNYGYEKALMILGIQAPFTSTVIQNRVDIEVVAMWNQKVMESFSLEESQAKPDQTVKKGKK